MKTGPGRYVLLVEDDCDDQDILVSALKELEPDLNIHVLDSGDKALDFIFATTADSLPSLIVLDYNLPKWNGHQLLVFLQNEARFKTVPKLVWSTSSTWQHKQRCLDSGAQAYLVKPTTLEGIKSVALQMLSFCRHSVSSEA